MLKPILRSAAFNNMLASVLAGYMDIIRRTTRWQTIGTHHAESIWQTRKGVILCIWHGRFFVPHAGWSKEGQEARALISQSNDGNIIARTAQKLGFDVIRGSSQRVGSDKDRGGARAFKEMVRHLRNNGCVLITPDGPRGPRMQSGDGAIRLAKMTGAPLLPYVFSTQRGKFAKSWDRFLIAFPFGRGVYIFGEPIRVERTATEDDVEAARALFEQRMREIQYEADRLMGREIITPDLDTDLGPDANSAPNPAGAPASKQSSEPTR